MRQALIITIAIITLSIFTVAPIAAQTDTGSQLPASDNTGLPAKEEDPITTPPAQNQDTKVQDFVSGISVGAAAGFVGGAVIAWFLKPKPSVA
jgi:hypothetical protein